MTTSTLGEQFIISRSQMIYLGFWLIVPFSCLAIHETLPIPPTLILFALGSIILFTYSKTISTSIVTLIPITCVLYFALSQALIGAPVERFVGVVFAICYFLIPAFFGKNLTSEELFKLSDRYILLSTLLLTAECVWRITHPDLAQLSQAKDGLGWIYQYKFTSFMYSESNATGIHVIVVLFYVLYQESEHDRKWTKTKWLLVFLLVLTFSRAAIVGAVIGWIYIRYLRKRNIIFLLANLVIISTFSFGIYQFYLKAKIANDLSLKSKFEIIDIVNNYFANASIPELLFGIGFSNSIERLGIYAHNFEMVMLIESGILGLMLMGLLFLNFALATRQKALYILVPFLVTTLSASIMFIPFFYATIALIYFIEKQPTPQHAK